ncbi:ribosomal protection-like ABC-F family protein [Staphylospora marina]|uniref:ribosomal protection-like ABC-F family protein n=1 Tax=Staphylospora marina TaxID=2490858 RepID=UPI001F1541D0|nr:ABC-F family ATP-binding cassette domain-containing protein [Staphylospora marina]
MLLETKDITKTYGGTVVLRQANLRIIDGERVALVGPNGAGKSTLIRIITGELPADSGDVYISRKARIGYLAQNSGLDSSRTVWEEMLNVFRDLRETEEELRRLEKEMGREEVWSDPGRYDRITEKYSALRESFERKGGYGYEARIRGALTGLGLGGLDWKNTPVSRLSGGQKTRAALAKLLLEQPDLLILDEPTNYLDVEAVTWLEQTLSSWKGALLLVSHDRWFLDRLVTAVYELENGVTVRYAGNYTRYVKQNNERRKQLEKAYEQQQEEIRRLEDFVRRNIARASTSKRAKSRQKMLQKMDRIDKPAGDHRKAAIRFETGTSSGRLVLETKGLVIGYDRPLIPALNVKVERGDRIALLGPNGTGKSTLLKTIAGQIPPLEGELKLGVHVDIDLYDQEQKDLHPDKTVIEELWDDYPHLDHAGIRSYLGQFLFSGEDVFKRVDSLSGGEKARLSLLKRLLNQANFLLMDEPTNHLDMESKERLEEALEHFDGTLLFVSHDRYFIHRLATRIWELTPQGIIDWHGGYEYWLEKKELARLETRQQQEGISPEKKGPQRESEDRRRREKEEQRKERQRLRRIEELEKEIDELERELARVQEELCLPEVYGDPLKSAELSRQLNELEQSLAEKTDEWAELSEG